MEYFSPGIPFPEIPAAVSPELKRELRLEQFA